MGKVQECRGKLSLSNWTSELIQMTSEVKSSRACGKYLENSLISFYHYSTELSITFAKILSMRYLIKETQYEYLILYLRVLRLQGVGVSIVIFFHLFPQNIPFTPKNPEVIFAQQ